MTQPPQRGTRINRTMIWVFGAFISLYIVSYLLLFLNNERRYTGSPSVDHVIITPAFCLGKDYDPAQPIWSQFTPVGYCYSPLLLLQSLVAKHSVYHALDDRELKSLKDDLMAGKMDYHPFFLSENRKAERNPLKTLDLSHGVEAEALVQELLGKTWMRLHTVDGRHEPIAFAKDGGFLRKGDLHAITAAWRIRGGLLEIFDAYGDLNSQWAYDSTTGKFSEKLKWIRADTSVPGTDELVPFAQ